MKKTLWDEAARRELKERIGHLQADTPARWGRFNAPQMLIHCVDAMRMTSGEIQPKSKNVAMRFTPLKQLIIYVLPWPQGAPTAPELLNQEPGEWAEGIARLRAQIDGFATRDPKGQWPVHPVFGKMTPRLWGALGYRHLDHHLRQFGV